MYKNEIYVKMLGLALPYIRNLQQLEKKEKILNLSCYHLQAFNSATGQIQEEPQLGLETVLCLRLCVDSELEPNWTLVSQRAEALGQERNHLGS